MSKQLVEANRQHQDLLEAHRADPDDEGIWEEYCRAKKHMEYLLEIHNLNNLMARSGPRN